MCSGKREGEEGTTGSSVFSPCQWKRLGPSSVVFQHYPRRVIKHNHNWFSLEKDLFMLFSVLKKVLFFKLPRADSIAQASFSQINKCHKHVFSLQHCPNTCSSLRACEVRKFCHSHLEMEDGTGEVPSQGQLSSQWWRESSHHCPQNPLLLNHH